MSTDTVAPAPAPPEKAYGHAYFHHVYADINAPIDKVFSILTDLPKYHEWCVGPFLSHAALSNTRGLCEQESICVSDVLSGRREERLTGCVLYVGVTT